MTDYDEALAARVKSLSSVWDFPDLNTRFVGSPHAGLVLPGGWQQFTGARPASGQASELDIEECKVTVGSMSFSVPDPGRVVTKWLGEKDETLAGRRVLLRRGFVGGAEANYQTSYWILRDFRAGAAGGGYVFECANVLDSLGKGLYQDMDGESYNLGEQLDPNEMTITLDKSPKGKWREPGTAIIHREDKQVYELVYYVSISGKKLQTVTRRYIGIGLGGVTSQPDNARISQVWVRTGNPLTLMLNWMLTTKVFNGNGQYDLGTGDGLGDDIKSESVNKAAIEALRDTVFPEPLFDVSGNRLSGVAVMFVERDPIEDLGEWISAHICRPFGLYPVVDASERFSLRLMYEAAPTVRAIGGEWRMRDFEHASWTRGYERKVNSLRLRSDWSIGDGEFGYSQAKEHAVSISRYRKGKVIDIEGRGCRSGLYGFKDYGSLTDLQTAGSRYLLDAANPWSEIEVRAFMKHRDLGLGDVVSLDLPTVPDLPARARGMVGKSFIVTRREVREQVDGAYAVLGLRQRRPIFRPAFVAPDTVASSYTAASASDRQYCYVTPDDAEQFSNGDEAYRTVP